MDGPSHLSLDFLQEAAGNPGEGGPEREPGSAIYNHVALSTSSCCGAFRRGCAPAVWLVLRDLLESTHKSVLTRSATNLEGTGGRRRFPYSPVRPVSQMQEVVNSNNARETIFEQPELSGIWEQNPHMFPIFALHCV